MKIMNVDNIEAECLYYCYSPNLYKFLRYIKKIEPIDIGTHRISKKKFSIFIKCDDLQKALNEWKKNKITGDLAIVVRKVVIQKVGEKDE